MHILSVLSSNFVDRLAGSTLRSTGRRRVWRSRGREIVRRALRTFALAAMAAIFSTGATASVYRIYMEGPGTMEKDQLGLFGPPTDVEQNVFVRSLLEFTIPTAPLELNAYPVEFAALHVVLLGRSIDVGFTEQNWLLAYGLDEGGIGVFGTTFHGPSAYPVARFLFGTQPQNSPGQAFPAPFEYVGPYGGIGRLEWYDPDTYRDTYVSFGSTRTVGRPLDVPLPEPSTIWLAPLALLLARAARRVGPG